MYLDLNGYYPRRIPHQPERKPVKLSVRQQKLLLLVIGLNLALSFIAPICGSSWLQGIVFVLTSN